MHDPMLELLFSEYRRKVLSLLFIEAGQAFHVRNCAAHRNSGRDFT